MNKFIYALDEGTITIRAKSEKQAENVARKMYPESQRHTLLMIIKNA